MDCPSSLAYTGCFDIRLGDDLNIEDSRSIYKEQTRASNYV